MDTWYSILNLMDYWSVGSSTSLLQWSISFPIFTDSWICSPSLNVSSGSSAWLKPSRRTSRAAPCWRRRPEPRRRPDCPWRSSWPSFRPRNWRRQPVPLGAWAPGEPRHTGSTSRQGLRFRGSQVLRFRGSEVQGFRGSKLRGIWGSEPQRFWASEVLSFRGSDGQSFWGPELQKFRDSEAQRSRGSELQGFWGSGILSFRSLKVLRFRGLEVLSFRGSVVLTVLCLDAQATVVHWQAAI